MSRTSFYRKFMSIAEMSPKDYLTRFRINKAIKLIKDGEESFGEISYLCGFNSQSIFSVTFKKEKGVTPLMYKKSL
jgi:AraC-like DNA-binding protein